MILLYQRIIPNYRLPIFNRMINEFGNLKIVYGQKGKNELTTIGEIPPSNNYNKINNYYFNSNYDLFYSNVFKLLLKERPKVIIVVANLGNLSLYPILFLKFIFNYKVILWTHGWNRKKGFMPNKSILDKIRLLIYKNGDAVLLYSPGAMKTLSDYLNPDKLFVANNTLDTSLHEDNYIKFCKIGRDSIKSTLNLNRKYYLVFLGKLVKSKQPFLLIKLFEELIKKGTDIGLIYIGDGPEIDEIKNYINIKQILNVHLLGQIKNDELIGKYLFSSDLMIIPGFVGLAVIHAFSFRCPVVTFEQDDTIGPFHSPEIEYIKNGITGFIINNGDLKEMLSQIEKYLSLESLHNAMKSNIEKVLKEEASINNMIDGFKMAINYVRNK